MSDQQFSVEQNPYENIYVDLTQRCNMDCNLCYNPSRRKIDMDIRYFEEVCRRLPNKVHFRFLGGEPTLHPHFTAFISTARRHRHHVYFSSNGIKYCDLGFMRRLKAINERFVLGLSMDGGTQDDKYYELLNNRRCLRQKLIALENLRKFNIGRVCLSAIIARGENEPVIKDLLELAERYSDVVRYIHFRSAAKVGRWIETEPYTLQELESLLVPYFTKEQLRPWCVREIHCTPDELGDCCFRFRPTPRLQISLIEFATAKSAQCPRRGKLLDEGFLLEPFFLNMLRKSETLEDRFGEVSVALPLATAGK